MRGFTPPHKALRRSPVARDLKGLKRTIAACFHRPTNKDRERVWFGLGLWLCVCGMMVVDTGVDAVTYPTAVRGGCGESLPSQGDSTMTAFGKKVHGCDDTSHTETDACTSREIGGGLTGGQ